MTALRVLHIGSERRWRGGENQIRLLIEGSRDHIDHFVAYPRESLGLRRFAGLVDTLPLARDTATSPGDLLRLRRFCREHRIDLIDAHSSNGHSLALFLRALGVHVPLVVHRRVDNRIRTGWQTRWKYRSPPVSRFIAISQRIAQILVDYGIPPASVALVRSGVPIVVPDAAHRRAARAALVARHALAPETVLIGNASALTHQKGYETLLSALAELRHTRNVSFHCFIAGDGPLRGALEERCRQARIDAYVSFLGHVDSVGDLLSGLDILAMPSNNEGLGTLLLDAALAGCALAATDVGGIPEVVRHGETGLLSPVGDAIGLASNLARLAEDPSLRHSLNATAIGLVEREFSAERMVAGNLEVYRNVLAEERSRA